MSDCCSSSACESKPPKKYRCPANGQEYAEVSARTILHQLKQAWAWSPTASAYYYCDDPACDVVYFGNDDSVILRSQLRADVGAKSPADDALLCYCFGVSRADYQRDPSVKDFVTAQTKAGACACETRNPSGRCCLKDFPKNSG